MPPIHSLIYTIEVDGTPTITFLANQLREAAELCKETWLRDDLASLTSNGVPVCHSASKLKARIATEAESLKYREMASEVEASDEIVLAYLVEIDGAG